MGHGRRARGRRLQRWRARRRARRRRGSGSARIPRQQQERRPNSSGPSKSVSARSSIDSLIEIERLAAIVERRGASAETSCSGSTAACTPRPTTSSRPRTRTRSSASPSRMRLPRLRASARSRVCRSSACTATSARRSSAQRVSRSRRRDIVELHASLLEGGAIPVLNLGGGFGIAYTAADDPTPDRRAGCRDRRRRRTRVRGARHPHAASRVRTGPRDRGTGRRDACTRSGTTKPVALGEGATRLYVSVDGGMSDNPRAALYGAQYSARIASRESDAAPVLARVVGKHCESGDIVVDAEYLPGDIAPGRPRSPSPRRAPTASHSRATTTTSPARRSSRCAGERRASSCAARRSMTCSPATRASPDPDGRRSK